MSARSTTPRRRASKCVRSEQDARPLTIADGTPQLATAVVTGSKPTIMSAKTSASDTTKPITLARDRVEANTPTAAAAPAIRNGPR